METTARRVRATIFATPSDREIVITRDFDAPRRRDWEAWTGSEHLPHGMLGPGGWTMPVCAIDLRPGGAWHFAGRQDQGAEMALRGKYREVAPPERLVSAESRGGDWPETLNALVLTEEHGGTTATQTILYLSKEARDAALGSRMEEGMSRSLDRLADYLRAMA